MSQTAVCLVFAGIMLVVAVIMMKAAVTANWKILAGSGLPLLDQMIQISHGAWISTVEECTTTVRMAATVSVV